MSKNINEKSIGSISKTMKVILNLDKTNHATQRQSRGDDFISDSEIKTTAQKFLDKIIKSMTLDKINIGDEILLKDKSNDLNLIGRLSSEKNGLVLVIITVMRKKDFRPKDSRTKVISDNYKKNIYINDENFMNQKTKKYLEKLIEERINEMVTNSYPDLRTQLLYKFQEEQEKDEY